MKRFYCLAFSYIFLLIFFGNNVLAQENEKTMSQIRLLLQEKQSRTPTQRKISSQLLQAVREKRGRKMVEGLTLNKANVNADAAGLLNVDIRATVTDSLLSAIEDMDGKIIFASKQYNAIRAQISLLDVENIAASGSVQFIGPAVQAFTAGSNSQTSKTNNYSNPSPKIAIDKSVRRRVLLKERLQKIQTDLERYLNTGSVNSQGDHAHRADDVRNAYGAQGQGIKIGVLSDSYNAKGGAAADVYNGNLPGKGNPLGYTTPVTVLADTSNGDDEGRAMLQIVHDLAPKAQLFFATAEVSEASFATNITTLRNTYNCDIIIDDIIYIDEPAFQDGIVAQAVNTVTASGALYFSSAGNEGSVAKSTAGVWEGDFNDAGSLAFVLPQGSKSGTIHNWGTTTVPVNGNIITSAGNKYILTWSDPFNASSNDYDLFLISGVTGGISSFSTDIQNGTQQAYEGINTQNLSSGDRLVIFKEASAQVRAFSLNTFGGKLTKSTTGQTHGHSAAADAFSVAAASALQTNGVPFSTGNVAENFTSDGLRRIFYNADGSPVTPNNLLFATNGGVVRRKPDITAADGVSTSLPLNLGLNPFYGTSAAAPHAGAIAALIKSVQPAITATQMRSYLTTTALDIESAGYDNVSGYGIVQAYQSMQASNPALVADVSLVSFANVEIAGDNGSGAVDPGERINLVVTLKNTSPATATSVTGILSTNTTGVTIANATSTYGNLSASASANNAAAPFVFTVANSVTCGTQINFTLTLNFGNGVTGPQSFPLVVTVGNQPIINIAGVLGNPAASTNKFTSSTGTQTGRIARNGIVSICGTAKIAPNLGATTGSRSYDAYVFTNTTTSSQCINVTFSSNSNTGATGMVSPLLYSVAYNNNGFTPAIPNTNFAADSGTSSIFNSSYGFSVNAGDKYTVVVHEINPSTASGASYYLNINSNGCSNVILPVTWLSFTAVEKNGQAALEWKVAKELNVISYEVEHSIDGMHFTKIYTLPAQTSIAPEKTYNQIHPFPDQGNNYYRIREVDKDGHFTYSATGLLVFNNVNDVIVTPTIASAFIKVQSKYTIDGIKLYNAVGQLVMNISPASTVYSLPINNLPAGAYFLHVVTANKTYQQKIIKQ